MANYLMECYLCSLALACRTLLLNRSTYYQKSVKDDSEVEAKLLAFSKAYPTRGFDWYYLKIRNEGLKWNRKRVLRIYRNMGLKLRRKAKKRINRPYQYALAQPLLPNHTWSMDFMSDTLEDGRRVRVLLIMDDYNREILAIEVALSITSTHVKGVLERLIFERGKPQHIRTDNGPEFIAHELKDYCVEEKIEQWFIQPGKPNQNGLIERLNRTFREDVLDAYIFENLEDLRYQSQRWMEQYNQGHPHQSLGGKSPLAFKYARKQVIAAYEKVKAEMNDASKASALTFSPPAMIGSLRDI